MANWASQAAPPANIDEAFKRAVLDWLTAGGTQTPVTPPPVSATFSGSIGTVNQGTPGTLANGWPVKVTDGTNVLGTPANPINVTGAAGGLSVVDEAAWTAGVSLFVPTGGAFNDAAAALTSGQQGTVRLTPNRAVHMNLRSQAGLELATAANPLIGRLEDGTTTQLATVAQQHLGDGLVQPAAGGAVLTSGPSQITDLIGTASRLREAGADQQPVLGVQSGIASLQQEFLTTCSTTVTAGTGGVVAPSVAASAGLLLTVTTTTGMKVGGKFNLEPGTANYESSYIKTINSATTVTVVFPSGGALFTHTANYTVQWFLANQERDFSGEGPMALGIGAAMAAEFESNSGGPPLTSGLPSGLTLDADRNWQGKAVAQLAISSTGAGNTSLTFTGNPWTSGLIVGQPILLSATANGAAVEEVTVSKNNTPATGAGPVTVNLVNPVVNAASLFATFDIFGLDGPANGNATPFGIEDSAIYIRDPAPTDAKRPFVAWKGTAGVGQVQIAPSGTATLTNLANATANATALAANTARKIALFFNDDTPSTGASVFLKFGAVASSTSFTVKILAGALFELPLPAYTGQIDVIATAATGTLRITEQT